MSRPRIAQIVLALVSCALPALAADVGVSGTRLVLEEGARNRRVELVVRDEGGVTKGPGGDAGLSARLEIFYTEDPGALHAAWDAPAPWKTNRPEVARFANRAAPAGPTTARRIAIRDGRSLRFEASGFGDGELVADLGAGAPSADGGITVVFTLQNPVDGSTHRMCTRFAQDAGSVVEFSESRRGRRLVARRGVPAPCPIDLEVPHPEGCEILTELGCLLPYPSSQFLVPAPTATGVRVSLPQAGMPDPNGPEVPASLFDGLDGFSPGVQILMHFRGVSPELSDAPRLLPPNCCGQPSGPPWIDTRTYDARSLELDSPSVLLDADTGERIVHFIETDARAENNRARQVLFLRPGRFLTPGHRYVVAMRNLVRRNGNAVEAEPVFAALRDGVVTSNPRIEARRPKMEAVFDVLEANGVARDDLVLAFDFVVRSEEQLTGDILTMRDRAYEWLDGVEADPGRVSFDVTSVTELACTSPTGAWRVVRGQYDSPLFLTGDLDDATTPGIARDAAGKPVQTGITRAPFTIHVPCSVRGSAGGAFPSTAGAFLDAPSSPIGAFPVLMGHGLFQTGDFIAGAVPNVLASQGGWKGISGGTDWRGLSGPDLGWVGTRIIGAGSSQLHNFPAFPARLHQGVVNTLVLARMMKRGLFNRHEAFVRPNGTGLFPGDDTEMGYWGISLGGIMGTYIAGLTPDVKAFALDVPAANFNCMLQRATPFRSFDALLNGIGLTDPFDQALGIGLTNELWTPADPVAIARHVVTDRLPGSGVDRRVLYLPAWLDKQVSNTCSEIAARTMGLENLPGSIQQNLVQIPTATGPTDAAMAMWHIGEIDILNPAHQPSVPPLANLFPGGNCDPHARRFVSPAAIRQIVTAISPGGEIVDTCTGLCDGAEVDERPLSGCVP